MDNLGVKIIIYKRYKNEYKEIGVEGSSYVGVPILHLRLGNKVSVDTRNIRVSGIKIASLTIGDSTTINGILRLSGNNGYLDAKIGSNCSIDTELQIYDLVSIKNRCLIGKYCSIYMGAHLQYKCTIKDSSIISRYSTIGHHATISGNIDIPYTIIGAYKEVIIYNNHIVYFDEHNDILHADIPLPNSIKRRIM